MERKKNIWEYKNATWVQFQGSISGTHMVGRRKSNPRLSFDRHLSHDTHVHGLPYPHPILKDDFITQTCLGTGIKVMKWPRQPGPCTHSQAFWRMSHPSHFCTSLSLQPMAYGSVMPEGQHMDFPYTSSLDWSEPNLLKSYHPYLSGILIMKPVLLYSPAWHGTRVKQDWP